MPHSQPKPDSAASARASNHLDCPTYRAAQDARNAVLDAADGLDSIRDAQQAYEALEVLITPVMLQDSERLEVTRSQLGQLMRVINRSIREQIATTQQAITIAKEST